MDVVIEGVCFRHRGQEKLKALTFKLGLSGVKSVCGGEASQREDDLGMGKELGRFGEWSEDSGAELSEGKRDTVREVGQVSSP